MVLALKPSYAPMDARLVEEIPRGSQWQYEPKWDGFRALVFRDGAKVQLRSKSGQHLERYFPEVVDAILKVDCSRFVVDGEIVVMDGRKLSFDALLQRIHPAASRIRKLSQQTPATLLVFDLLVGPGGDSLADEPLRQRRRRLEAFNKNCASEIHGIVLSPATTDPKIAAKWFGMVGGGMDGIIAKRLDLPYQSGNRDGMVKIKKLRTADCVVGGFRYASKGKEVGSLLLGLYDDKGLLHHVGFCSSFKSDQRKELRKMLEPLIQPPGFTGQAPGGPSRWSTKRSTEWQPLETKLVVEVRYDHFTSGRFRHGTKFLRWRPDKAPKQCTMKQVAQDSARLPIRLG